MEERARPSHVPDNLCLVDTGGPHKKVVLQLSQTGQYFHGTSRICGDTRELSPETKENEKLGFVSTSAQEMTYFCSVGNIIL